MSLFEGAEPLAPTQDEPKEPAAKKPQKVKNEGSRPMAFGRFVIQSGETLAVPSMSRDMKKRLNRAIDLGILSKV